MGSPTRNIEAALSAHLQAFAEDGPFPVSWPNVEFTPTVGVAYLKADFLPGEPFQADVGVAGSNRHTGIFQVKIYYPEKTGKVDVSEITDELVDHFKRGTTLTQGGTSVRITKSYAGPALNEPGWLVTPITVRYRCYAAN